MIGKPLYRSLFSNKVAGLQSPNLPKKVPAQVLFCQFCEIFKNNFLKEHWKLLLIFVSLW